MRRNGLVLLLALFAVPVFCADNAKIRVLVWDEQQPAQKKVYAKFLGNEIAQHLQKQENLEVTSVRLDDPEQGLAKDVLDKTDVLIWWGHVRHRELASERAADIVERIKAGKLSLIALHSAHWAAPFVKAMEQRSIDDALAKLSEEDRKSVKVSVIPFKFAAPKRTDPLTPSSELKQNADGSKVLEVRVASCIFPAWRADGAPSHVTTLLPNHPIAKGIPKTFDIPQTEMYDEPFHVPPPDALVFEEKWDKGERFRSGCVWSVGKGKVFYFRPGHETYGVYKEAIPLQIIANAVQWMGAR
ncbi:MAG TPA: ThuA domain-containing protein [Planctomycetota bacterium]|nr:ThuA domain-containing protein [Planctomycetota bacterium]